MELSALSAARRDPNLVVLEGFHAIKHALRFGGHMLAAWTAQPDELEALRSRLAPDIQLPVQVVAADELTTAAPRCQVVGVARRPAQPDTHAVLAGPGHVVFLENPRHLGNLGAVVRVAAAAGAAGVFSSGTVDPWHPDVLRGSAGLHFALPVHHVDHIVTGSRELIAVDPEGDPLSPAAIPEAAVLAFGTERDGLSDRVLAAADRRVALPMAPGVSSLNLATSVAATLYALRFGGG
ncbi:MAG: TrmH family RNA methyltransferase [Solirubrobacterales bacterium]|nr:TrmH family RNA methyltransferase [Solirubrobacterales bacterium]